MERIDCEKCIHSEFYDDDKLRCSLKKCQPNYPDMVEERQSLLNAFPKSFINERDEFIAEPRWNQYFILSDCEYPEDIYCKVLESLSRSASYSIHYSSNWRNERYHKHMQDCINEYLGTQFTQEDFRLIYEKLGNAIHHNKTVEFVKRNYDFDVLNSNLQETDND